MRVSSYKGVLQILAWILYLVLFTRFLNGQPLVPKRLSHQSKRPGEIDITIVGEVQSPGVYTLDANSSVLEGIQRAGGTTKNADLSRLNLSVPLLDRSVLRVPSKDQGFLPVVSLNRSPASELSSLPGIGSELAGRIVRYRRAHGPFAGRNDLLRVRGIGSKKADRILREVVIDPVRP